MCGTWCRPTAAVALWILVVVLATPAGSTMMGWHTLENMTASSELIVQGRVVSVESAWNDEHTRIFTEVFVSIDDRIKGPDLSGVIRLQLLGGQVGDVVLTVPGMARFTQGEEVLLFLSRAAEYLLVTGMAQGKFSVITNEATGRKRLERDVSGVAFFGTDVKGTDPGTVVYLDDMLGRVRGIMEE